MIYKLISLVYDNLKTLMPLALAVLGGIWYLVFSQVRTTIKNSKRTWNKDKYRKY